MDMVEAGQNRPEIATKRTKFEETVEEGGEDRVSALPDFVLLEILSRLDSTKYAIRTGTLSKRWKHVWTSVPSLILEDENHPFSNSVSSFSKTLTQCRQLKLKKFVVRTAYDTQSESQIHNWIRFAINCNVEELNLKLYNFEERANEFLLDQLFFVNSSFTDLRLSGCIWYPSGEISWKNLRRLWISEGMLEEEIIENILSGCPQLETLVLNGCYGYSRLNITSKSIKNLVFRGYLWVPPDGECDDFTHIIEINAPNILSLTIDGGLFLWRLLLVNMSSLTEANLNYKMVGHDETIDSTMVWAYEPTLKEEEEEMLKRLTLSLCHVKEVKIGVRCSKVVSRLEEKGFVFPSNVKLPDVTSPVDSDDVSTDSDY